jgi:type IV pilus assembly protein PilB
LKDFHLNLAPDADGAMTEAAGVLLRAGIYLNASDLHIEPWYPRLRFRVNGYFRDFALQLSDTEMQNLAGRLKVLASLKSWEQGLIQEGRIEGEFFSSSFPARMSVFPTINGEKIVLRYLGHGQTLSRLTDLGYTEQACELIRETLFASGGLFLIYGSSNSGKTTAAYAVLNEISACRGAAVSIATIEDPVERNTRLFAQTDLSAARGIVYEKALKSLLRQDPEVIFVGEIRDAATAGIAFQAALTGHFIVTTIHAGSLSEGLLRLMGFGLDVRQIFMVLRMALGLELFPVNCEHCRVFSELEPGDFLKIAEGADAGNMTAKNLSEEKITCASSSGCDKCGGLRFSGRVPVYDLLSVSGVMRRAVVENPADWSKLILPRNISRFSVLLELVENGVISPYEIFRQV